MAKKYSKCIKCDVDTELNYAKYCDACRRPMRLKSLQNAPYKPKDKPCRNCNESFFAIGPSSLYCAVCGPKIHSEKFNIRNNNYRRDRGIKVGVGSGNNQGKGPTHHSFKNGIETYRKLAREAKGNTCERCNIVLNFSTRGWCVHHKDHDRTNNKLDNLELLCRRCHALEHDCISHLPNK